MGGNITPTGSAVLARGGLEFGRAMREKYWTFEEGWVNINHGTSLPRPNLRVLTTSLQDRMVSLPNQSFKRSERYKTPATLRPTDLFGSPTCLSSSNCAGD